MTWWTGHLAEGEGDKLLFLFDDGPARPVDVEEQRGQSA